MKYFKYLVFLIILFTACKKEYFDIDANKKDVFLFNAYNIGDTFRMINYNNYKNDTIDTITFTVVQKDIKYTKRYHSFNKYDQYYILAFTCNKTDSHNSGGVYFTREDTVMFLNELYVKRVIEENDTLTVNGFFYNNLYKFSNGDGTYALISKKYGIVKMWNPYSKYELLP